MVLHWWCLESGDVTGPSDWEWLRAGQKQQKQPAREFQNVQQQQLKLFLTHSENVRRHPTSKCEKVAYRSGIQTVPDTTESLVEVYLSLKSYVGSGDMVCICTCICIRFVFVPVFVPGMYDPQTYIYIWGGAAHERLISWAHVSNAFVLLKQTHEFA